MNGTIEYISPVDNNPFYRLLNFDNGNLYAVEIMTASPESLSDSNYTPGDMCCALFAITKDEFDLKDSNTDALNKFVFALFKNIPEDRLIEACYTTQDNQKKPMQPKPGCKTMDHNKFENYRQRIYAINRGIPFLNTAKKIYVIYDKVTSDRLPAITWNGLANIFTKREYAENIIKNSEVTTLDIKEFEKADFDEHIKTWHAFGILKFSVNAGTQDHPCTILRDDYMPDANAKNFEYNGSALCMYLWRYRQYVAYKTETMNALARTFFSSFCHKLKETLFLCPFVYDGENYPASQPDYVLHTSSGSVKLISDTSSAGNIKFYGGEKYEFSNTENTNANGVMHPLTVNSSGGAFLAAFTDFCTLQSIFGENVRVATYTYDELRLIAGNEEILNGIVINPNSATMPIHKKDMELIEKISSEQQKFYVPGSDNNEDLSSEQENINNSIKNQPKEKSDCDSNCSDCKENSTTPESTPDNTASSEDKNKKGLFGKIKKMFK